MEKPESRRIPRVEREIREILGMYIITRYRAELKGLVTVSKVRVTADLKLARIYVSVLGSPQDQDASLEVLEDNGSDIQRHLGRELKIKFCPKLQFFLDTTTDEFLKVQQALRDIKDEETRRTSTAEPLESDDE